MISFKSKSISESQQDLAEIIISQCKQIQSLISRALNSHMNINQSITVNTSSMIMSLEKVPLETLPNKTISLTSYASIKLPSKIQFNLNDNSSVIMRVKSFLFGNFLWKRMKIILVEFNTISNGWNNISIEYKFIKFILL